MNCSQDAHQGGPPHHHDSPSPAPPSIAGGSDSMDATVASTPNNSTSSLANSPTPPKKDRSSTRKTCQYCHKVSNDSRKSLNLSLLKIWIFWTVSCNHPPCFTEAESYVPISAFLQDFHEMSLKRHIKDVHFRNQNTYVICPQCCKQYASQNSLYSHLNRVHGVKKDMLQDMQLQMVQQNSSGGSSTAAGQPQAASADNNGSSSSSSTQPQAASAASAGGSNNHEGIMDLAHHSDSSN